MVFTFYSFYRPSTNFTGSRSAYMGAFVRRFARNQILAFEKVELTMVSFPSFPEFADIYYKSEV